MPERTPLRGSVGASSGTLPERTPSGEESEGSGPRIDAFTSKSGRDDEHLPNAGRHTDCARATIKGHLGRTEGTQGFVGAPPPGCTEDEHQSGACRRITRRAHRYR